MTILTVPSVWDKKKSKCKFTVTCEFTVIRDLNNTKINSILIVFIYIMYTLGNCESCEYFLIIYFTLLTHEIN